jgi:hypothetical protein
MRNLLAAFLLFLGLTSAALAENTVGPSNQVLCNKIAVMAVGPTTSTLLVAAVTGQTIFVCGFQVTNTGAAGTFTFTSGSGATCGTGTTTQIPPMNVTNAAPATYNVGVAQWAIPPTAAVPPVAQALCVTPSVATIAVVVWFSQF